MKTIYTSPRYPDNELLEIFPEIIRFLPKKIEECQADISSKESHVEKILGELYSLQSDTFSEWFGEEVIRQFEMPQLLEYEKRLVRLRRFKLLADPNSTKNHLLDFENKLEIARNYPIEALARERLEVKQSGKSLVSLCPFHNEKTPSFYIYPDSNRFYCFGCHESGDILKLTMHLCGVDFKDAVLMLQN